MDSPIRYLAKTVTYRIPAILGTLALSWAITRNIGESASITIIIHVFLTALYYVNERAWDRSDWGRRTRS